MRAIADPTNALGRGLAAIRRQYQVPDSFPAEVLAAAEEAARREPTRACSTAPASVSSRLTRNVDRP